MRGSHWGAEEDDLVRALYPDYIALQTHFPLRSLGSIRGRAKSLGIQHKRRRWLASHRAILRREWDAGKTVAQIAAEHFPDVEPNQAKWWASFNVRGTRERRALAKLGSPVLDDIRTRARERGLTMAQLDKQCGAGVYFQHNRKEVVVRWVVAAVEMLGGDLDVAWRD